MNIKERSNTVVIEIDLDSGRSVDQAIEFIQKNTPSYAGAFDIKTDKIRLIKLLRAFGMAFDNGEVDAGLKSTKAFVESNMRIIKKE